MNSGKSNAILAASIVTAAFIIGGALVWSTVAGDRSDKTGLADVGGIGEDGDTPSKNPEIDDDVIFGDADAPVTLIEFGDYQCPFCKKMYDETEKLLRDEYVKAGKLKIVYRDFPLDQIHPYARRAAEAAECARDEGKYWAYHDALFTRQAEIPVLDFVKLAKDLGLSESEFASCVSSGKYAAEVENDLQEGLAAGVTGTPGNFIIAGGSARSLPGAVPYATFKLFIDQALSEIEK